MNKISLKAQQDQMNPSFQNMGNGNDSTLEQKKNLILRKINAFQSKQDKHDIFEIIRKNDPNFHSQQSVNLKTLGQSTVDEILCYMQQRGVYGK